MSGNVVTTSSATGQVRRDPSDFLKQVIGRPVVVKLNSGVDYRGILACLDGCVFCRKSRVEFVREWVRALKEA